MKGKIKYIVCVLLIAALFSTTVSAAYGYPFDGIYWQAVAAGTNLYYNRSSGGITSVTMNQSSGTAQIGGEEYNFLVLKAASQIQSSANATRQRLDNGLNFTYNLRYQIPLNIEAMDSVSLNFAFGQVGSASVDIYIEAWYDIVSWVPSYNVSSEDHISGMGGTGEYQRFIDLELSGLNMSIYGCQYIDVYINLKNFSYEMPSLYFFPSDSSPTPTDPAIIQGIEEIGDKLDQIYEQYLPRPGDDEDMEAIESGMSDVGDKLESAGEILGNVETVDPDDLPIGFDDVVGDNFIYDDVSGFFSVLMGPTFVIMGTIVLSLGLISYIMFGKKG